MRRRRNKKKPTRIQPYSLKYPTYMQKLKLLSAIIAIFLLASCGAGDVVHVPEDIVEEAPILAIGEHHNLETDEYYFDVEPYGEFSPDGNWDGRIIQTNIRTGEKLVLIESVKATGKLEKWNEIFVPFAFDETRKILYLDKVPEAIEAVSPIDLWKYYLETEQLSHLNFRSIGEAKNVAGFSLSTLVTPDSMKFIRGGYISKKDIEDGTSQYLLIYDIKDEAVSVLVKLSKNETLNAGYFALLERFDLSFGDRDTVEYGVFDQTKAQPQKEMNKPLIEKRRVKL